MNTYNIPHTSLTVSRLAYGCMNLGGWDNSALTAERVALTDRAVQTALELGINFFDHADIYGRGKSEEAFGEVLRCSPSLRQQMVLQSKCGIRFADESNPGDPHRYDFSAAYIVMSVEGTLHRLKIETLDILLLHRPDPLVEPDEVAGAFSALQNSGKVRYFGVSNHSPEQIELLKMSIDQPLVVNQLELNILHSYLISEGILANQEHTPYPAAAGTLDYCRRNKIMVQAWAPVANGALIDPPTDAPARVQSTAVLVAKLADKKGTTREAIALAWLLRHPAGIQPVIGTTQPERLRASASADQVELSREEWWALFNVGRGAPPP